LTGRQIETLPAWGIRRLSALVTAGVRFARVAPLPDAVGASTPET
jgi:hypothetical protein